jgi:nitrate reductase beta subunit
MSKIDNLAESERQLQEEEAALVRRLEQLRIERQNLNTLKPHDNNEQCKYIIERMTNLYEYSLAANVKPELDFIILSIDIPRTLELTDTKGKYTVSLLLSKILVVD